MSNEIKAVVFLNLILSTGSAWITHCSRTNMKNGHSRGCHSRTVACRISRAEKGVFLKKNGNLNLSHFSFCCTLPVITFSYFKSNVSDAQEDLHMCTCVLPKRKRFGNLCVIFLSLYVISVFHYMY